MESAENSFRRTLLAGAQLLGIRLDDDGVSRLVAHFRLLRKWIDRVNLTTVREPGEMAELLYLDSAVLLEHLEPGARAHDVGTGAGFPGLVLKALRLDLEITLTEARRKKVSFLKQAAREMRITDGLDIRHGRIGWDQAGDEGQWSEVFSRAAFPPEEWIRQGSRLVAPGGRLWILSGQPHGEGGDGLEGLVARLDAILPGGFERGRLHAYRLPFCSKARLLVPVRRLKEN